MALDISDIPTLLVIAGIIFLFIAIVRNISGTVATTIDRKAATILGISGVILLALGLITAYAGIFPPPGTKPIITPPPINVTDISPYLLLTEKHTPTSVEIIRVEQREEGTHIKIITMEEGKKTSLNYFLPFPPPTIAETPEPTPTSIPTETPIPTLT